MGLHGLPWRLENTTMDTQAGPNLIRRDAIPQSNWYEVSEMKPKQLRLAAGIPLPVIESIKLLMQLGQQVIRTKFLAVQNLVEDMLGTAFITKNIKNLYPGQGVVTPTGSGQVALIQQSKGKSQANAIKCPENHVDTEQVLLPCSIAKQKLIPELSEALI